MSGINESNINNYKSEHECNEHWQLRKKFLLTHADKFPEEQLVCLAQVFTNVEFLGCKYPNETMAMIAELSKDVVADYREKQKTRLQRTFVKASDAAANKSKGQSRTSGDINNLMGVKQNINFKAKNRIEFEKKSDVSTDIVLFEYGNDSPQSILSRAALTFGLDLEWKFEIVNFQNCTCHVHLNKKIFATGTGFSKKAAKEKASELTVAKLKAKYYTIRVTKNLTPTEDISKDDVNNETEGKTILTNDNVGLKLMKMMGYVGGGLGKSSQGIVEPVSVQSHMTREGLGLKVGFYNLKTFKLKCQETLQKFARGDMKADLVFSPSFSNEERALIHQIAKQMGLKSQSYGPKDKRTLTISRKIHPRELVNELLEAGGCTEKYRLILPTDEKV